MKAVKENKNRGKWVVLLGAPGCGKGTQSEYLIASDFNFKVVSVGEILRHNKDTIVPGQIKTIGELIGAGLLLPNEVVIGVVKLELEKMNSIIGNISDQNIIFDGFPRTIKQAEALDELAKGFNNSINYVINFEIKEDVLFKRILGRYKCSNCGRIYNDYFLPTKVSGVCDVCGGKVFDRRMDDNEESLKVRITEYYKNTYPLIDFYKKSNTLYNVNADDEFEHVKNCVLEILNKECK
ncbi:MAG: nucleoside monophosphate kinase [Alphaproteobacteria bacterium]|nr:nucleoside monophosphate kinase [Alphaproteobacteria bacterium]